MPVMNGPSAARQIRALCYDIFIMGITGGNILHEDAKPVRLPDLESLLQGHGLTPNSAHAK